MTCRVQLEKYPEEGTMTDQEVDDEIIRQNIRFATRIVTLERVNAELRAALKDLADASVNPGDGGAFETGELPELDKARALLSRTEPHSDDGFGKLAETVKSIEEESQ